MKIYSLHLEVIKLRNKLSQAYEQYGRDSKQFMSLTQKFDRVHFAFEAEKKQLNTKMGTKLRNIHNII